VTPGIGAKLREHGIAAEKLVAVGNATNLEHFHPSDRTQALATFALDARRRYIGFIGNLAPWQGLGTALAAFREIKDNYPAWHLLIAGDGPDRERLEATSRSLGVDGAVTFLGAVAYADAARCIGGFDIAIAPFTHARNAAIGLSPLKIRDYAACGRPVVTSDIPGLNDLAEAGWLLLHRPDDPVDMARALAALIEDERLRETMGAKARAFAEANFGWGDVAGSICAAMEGCDPDASGAAAPDAHPSAPHTPAVEQSVERVSRR
jgi:glycosyltransferase involved in cell wall biosynthesis